MSSSADSRLNELARRLRGATRVDSLGKLDGTVDEAFGMIADLGATRDGRILVLDFANLLLRVVEKGRPARTVGGRGDGPLEFRSPLALLQTGASEFGILDAVHGVKIFRLLGSGEVELTHSFRTAGSATAGCASGQSLALIEPLYVAASSTPTADELRLVRIYNATGKAIGSLGSTYKAAHPLVRRTMSEAAIACDSDGTIVVAISKLPFVDGYATDGTRRWTSRLADFELSRTIERVTEAGRVSIGLDPESPRGSYTRRIVPIATGFVLVQVSLMTAESLRDGSVWASSDSYLLSTRTGEGVYVGNRLPLLGALVGDVAYGFENDPFPRVVMLRLAK